MNKVNSEHFKFFKERTEKWIDLFGLTDWEYRIVQAKDEDDYMAWVRYSVEIRKATICLAEEWPDDHEVTLNQLDQSALHEVCELLLADIRYLATERYSTTEAQIHQEVHRIIARIINLVQKTMIPRNEEVNIECILPQNILKKGVI